MGDKKILGDGVVTGYGTVDGRTVFVFAQDFTVFGGSLSGAYAQKICKVMDLAMKAGAPVIGLNDSGGARIQEGVESLAGYADIFLRNTLASGVVPQLSRDPGPVRGRRRLLAGDHRLHLHGRRRTSYMFITGPDVIKAVTHEEVTKEELGGAHTHAARSGVAHFARSPTSRPASEALRELLSFLPQNNSEDPPRRSRRRDPRRSRGRELDDDRPARPDQALRHQGRASARVVDDGHFFEMQRELRAQHRRRLRAHGRARRSASSPTSRRTWPAASTSTRRVKAARFVRFCDCFNIPLVTFVDVPGFLPGTDQEYGGIIKHGAKLLYAFAEATVPKLTVITRKAYGGAYDVMASKHIRARHQLRLPDGGDRGHGPRGRGQHRLPRRAGARPPTRRRRARATSPTTARSSPTPTRRRSSATSTRSSARADARPRSSARWRC